MYTQPGGSVDMQAYEAHKAALDRRKYQDMDPMEAIQARGSEDRAASAVESLREQYPELSEAQAAQMVATYQKQSSNGQWSKQSRKVGSPEHQVVKTVGQHWHKQPAPEPLRKLPAVPEDRIRALRPSGSEPFIKQCLSPTDCRMVPNPEWGKQNGMIWDGERWVTDDPRRGAAHDMDMEMKKLEMERMRQQMAMEQQLAEEELRQKRGSTGVGAGLREWLARRLGGG
jgi:hypothetical protein